MGLFSGLDSPNNWASGSGPSIFDIPLPQPSSLQYLHLYPAVENTVDRTGSDPRLKPDKIGWYKLNQADI
jgi:hypothetical protein